MSGRQSDFAFLREDASRLVIGYGLKEISEDLCEWNEVYLYKKQKSSISLQDVKDAIIADINARTDEKILSGFVWNGKPVWLSAESQTNFSAAEYTASTKNGLGLPVTFKLGEQNGTPVYHEFTTVEELSGFYLQAQDYIKQCLGEGWQEKDGIDWAPYEALFPSQSKNDNQQAE
jgi:hypothetical protein